MCDNQRSSDPMWSDVWMPEEALLRQSGMEFFRIFTMIRKERRISVSQLVRGVISRRAFSDIENGKTVFLREYWELFMHRMGAATKYFEVVVSRKELEDWRQREDICLTVFENPEEARIKWKRYQENHVKRSAVEEQFCLKVDWLLARDTCSFEELYEMSCRAVECTVKGDWRENFYSLYLAPSELEAILLVVCSLDLLGKTKEALDLFYRVWKYPDSQGWESGMQLLIQPQAALVGMQLYRNRQANQVAFEIGQMALERLRQEKSQRYAYSLLCALVDVGMELRRTGNEPENLQQLEGFRDAFEMVYKENGFPCRRVWQLGSMEECYDVSLVLKRMRLAQGMTQEEVCLDERGFPFLQVRQLSRIEQGENRPSTETFQLLTRNMGCPLDWIMPIFNIYSIKTLKLWRDIVVAIGERDWEKTELLLNLFRREVAEKKDSQVEQEISFVEILLMLEKKELTFAQARENFVQALFATFPLEWYFFPEIPFVHEAEGMILYNIALMHVQMGEYERARQLLQSLESFYRPQQEILRKNNGVSSLVLQGKSYVCGEMRRYEEALAVDTQNLKYELAGDSLRNIGRLLYNKAWDCYEVENGQNQAKFQRNFSCAQQFAAFGYSEFLIQFLREREEKYLS